MANLFNNNILKDTLKDFEIPEFDEKLAIIKQRQETYKNGTLQKMTESEVEQSYNEDVLGKVLGYTKFPTIPYTRQPQPKTEVTGQKPDFGLGFYYQDAEKKDKTLAVIEVKDAKTDINKSQKREGNLSPIQQGFKYKPQYSDCRWVIVSNFFDTKLFVDTMIDYEYWTLDTLVDETDNYFQFRKFYYLLCADNLIKETGKSVTEELLSAVRIQEEKITKEFYKEYKGLRHELINDLIANNDMYSVTTLVEKAQKIIDRIVFIHFCEDTKEQLLPNGKLAEVVNYGEKALAPIRQTLSNFFEVVNSGSEKLDIPNGYNGGLFRRDPELDSLKVGDTICKKFVALGKYDFSEDISVNILGHVFEQSISDLEEIKAQLLEEKGSSKAGDMKQNKRKKDGIFYTPEYIVDYIVTNSLGKYLEEKFDECIKENKNEFKLYQSYQKILQNVKVLDPACGSGAFLVRVFDFLLEENIRVMKILSGGDTGMFDINAMSKEILQKNIYGVDLNAESVEITKLSLWLKTAQKGKKLATLDGNVKCGNSLIDDVEVAGDKAFDWNVEFKSIMDDGGFDVIVGNPPYVTNRLGKQQEGTEETEIEYYKKTFGNIVEYKGNLYSLFIGKSYDLLKTTGKFSFIVPNTFLLNKTHSGIRTFIINNFNILEFTNLKYEPFNGATIGGCCIFTFGKEKKNNKTYVKDVFDRHDFIQNEHDFQTIDYSKQTGCLLEKFYTNVNGFEIVKGCYDKENIQTLGDIVSFYQGIITGNNKKFISTTPINNKYKKIVRGADISRYRLGFSNNYVFFDPEQLWSNTDSKKFETNEKLINRQTSDSLVVVYDNTQIYSLDSTHIQNIISNEINIKYLLALENSSLLNFLYKFLVDEGGKTFAQVKTVNLKILPIKNITFSAQQPFIKKADQMLAMSKKFQEKIDFVLNFIQQKYNIEKLSNKLKKFYDYDFKEFKKQLKLKNLGLDDEAELMEFFQKKKDDVLELKAKIDITDGEIDEMVFELYGLSEAERKVVLGG